MAIQSTNPANNKMVKTFEEMSEKALDKAIEQAAATFEEWKKLTIKKDRRSCTI